MPLIPLWNSSPQAVGMFSIQQIVNAAGDGKLRNNSECSAEIRQYFRDIPIKKIGSYVEQCLTGAFDKSGMVLQDLINEIGRRLDYRVDNGQYQGTVNAVGFDGFWQSSEGHSLVVEVKTTDTYRISLDTIANYRLKLIASGHIRATSSILIVVGRDDTGELEAQVRGSRHAWDIRLISADAMMRLAELKENTEGDDTGKKIRSILKPMEYTRLDEMINIMFAAAKDVEENIASLDAEPDDIDQALPSQGLSQPTTVDPAIQQPGIRPSNNNHKLVAEKRDAVIMAFSGLAKAAFIKKSPAFAWTSDHTKRVVCAVSKRYTNSSTVPYWYAFHPAQHEFLGKAELSYLLLGCMDQNFAFALPLSVVSPILDALNTTTIERDARTYWHMKIVEQPAGRYGLQLPKQSRVLDLEPFRFAV